MNFAAERKPCSAYYFCSLLLLTLHHSVLRMNLMLFVVVLNVWCGGNVPVEQRVFLL